MKCYSGMANAACEVFDALKWKNVVGTLSGDNTFFVMMREDQLAEELAEELSKHMQGR